MPCDLCGAPYPPCTRPNCPYAATPISFPVLSLEALALVSTEPASFFFEEAPSTSEMVLEEKREPQTEWYSDDVMNLLFRHYAAQAHEVSVVPAVLGSDNALGINFLETFLTHHLLDHPQSRKPIVVPVNLGERHWVGLLLRFRQDGSVAVFYFDSISPSEIDAAVDAAVRNALGHAGFPFVDVQSVMHKPVQQDRYNCGPWVVEWLRQLLGRSWQTLPDIDSARAEHRLLPGVDAALQRDAQACGWWGYKDYGPEHDALSTLQDLLKQDVWRRFLLPLRRPTSLNNRTTLLDAAQDLLRTGQLPLGLLYRRFLDNPDAMALAEHLFRARMLQIDRRYHEAKELFVKAVGMNVDEKTLARPWQEKAPRLGAGLLPSKPYESVHFSLSTDRLLDLGPFRCADVSPSLTVVDLSAAEKLDWMALSVFLTVIRKRFARIWQQSSPSSSMTHITVVALPGRGAVFPCFWALNSKDERGSGTTRILLPLCEEPYYQRHQIRALDLSYEQVADLTVEGSVDQGEIHSSLRGLVDSLFPGESGALGRMFLDLMSSSPAVQRECRELLEPRNVPLPPMHCVLLRCGSPTGMRLREGRLSPRGSVRYPEFSGLITAAHPPKTAPGRKRLEMGLSALELAYYFLGIVVAETRHARGVYVSTLDLFELVELGFVQPEALFSDLDGQIEHGWLLPGANFLGGVLPPELKRLAMPLVGSLTRSGERLDALPDVQRAVSGRLQERKWNEEAELDDASHPVYQVLQKCLFITLLRFLAKCPGDAGMLLADVTGHSDAAGAWPVGHDIAPSFLGSSAQRGPDIDDLSALLFGEEARYECEALIRRARFFDGVGLQVFASLFRIRIQLHFERRGTWRFINFSPPKATIHTSTIEKDVLARLSLVYVDGAWRVLVPKAKRPEDFVAELRRIYTHSTAADFENLLECIEQEEGANEDDDDYTDGEGSTSV
jgi:hypothetical protein